MKKIVISTVHPLYPISHGGIVRVIEEAKFLSENGFEVHLIGMRTKKVDLKKVEKITGVKTYTFSKITYLTAGILSKLGLFALGWIYNPLIKRDIEELVEKIRPNIIQSEFIHSAYQMSKISRNFNIPFVVAEHNVEHIRLSEEGKGSGRKLKSIELKICNLADYVTTVSEKDKQDLAKIGVNSSTIKVIPNGVDYNRYQIRSEVRDRIRHKYGIEKNDIVLVFHGTLGYRPNITANELLKDYIFPKLNKEHKNLKLLLIGSGRSQNIGEKVIELDEISFSEFPMYLSMGDIGVVPITAGSGTRLKIIEYLALGIPTVSTEVGAEGLPVRDGEHIIIANDAKDGFVEKIIKLLNNKKLQERLNKNGKELVKEKLDWDIVLKGYLEVYKGLENRMGDVDD
ncbi:MAG: glycosyltransferase family 4 protein [Thermotogota bacterium]|nr:glycosyltransferase family 4 protein [Thermotogota bacterium]